MRISVYNLSGIYENEDFHRNVEGLRFIDCRNIPGTNGICDPAGKKDLEKALDGDPGAPYGLHFIDCGNFHYLTSLFTDRILEPFTLLLFDHHPDMQPSLFPGVLSCGGWVLEVLKDNPNIRQIVVVGADQELIAEVDPEVRKNVLFLTEKDLQFPKGARKGSDLERILQAYPLYISVDKDVCEGKDFVTNWDQGTMPADHLLSYIKRLCRGCRVLGMDICGDGHPDMQPEDLHAAISSNDRFNREVLSMIRNFRI